MRLTLAAAAVLVGCTAQTFDNEKPVDITFPDSGTDASTADALPDASFDTSPADAIAEVKADASPDQERCLAGAPRLEFRDGACWDVGAGTGAPFPCTFVKSAEGGIVRCFPLPLVEPVGARTDDCPSASAPLLVNVTLEPFATTGPRYVSVLTPDGFVVMVSEVAKVEIWHTVSGPAATAWPWIKAWTCDAAPHSEPFPFRNPQGKAVRATSAVNPSFLYNVPG